MALNWNIPLHYGFSVLYSFEKIPLIKNFKYSAVTISRFLFFLFLLDSDGYKVF